MLDRRRWLPVLLAALIAFSVTLAGCGGESAVEVTPPPSAWLAVVQQGSLLLIPVDGATEPRVVADGVEQRAVWSPNGQQLAYIAGGDLWVTRIDGPARRLTKSDELGGGVRSLVWSPDSDRIVFESGGSQPGLWSIDSAGGDPALRYGAAAEIGGWWGRPEFAGRMLVVRDATSGDVYLVDEDELTRRQIFSGAAPLPHLLDERVLYVDVGGDLAVWSATSGEQALTQGFGGVLGGQWSPDGQWIAFEQGTGWEQQAGIWVLNLADGIPRFLADGHRPVWTGDGSEVLYERDSAILARSIESGEERVVASGTLPAWQPVWPPLVRRNLEPPEPEGRNLINDGSFEQGLDGWFEGLFTPPGSNRTENDSFYGDAAAEIVFGAEDSYFGLNVTPLKETLQDNTVTFSAWVKTSATDVRLRYITNNANIDAAESPPHPGDGAWHRLLLSFIPRYDDPEPTDFIQVGIFANEGVASALVDGVQLELGATETPFEPPANVLEGLRRPEPVPGASD